MRGMLALGLLVAVVSSAPADQYWVSYEADGVYPEDCGWSRRTDYGGAQRWFEDGALVLDSRASLMIDDGYSMSRPGALDPGLGELFVIQWRLRIDELQGPWDQFVGVFSDGRRLAALDFSSNGVHVPGEGLVATFDPGEYHYYEFRSSDMLTYELYLDGVIEYVGEFTVPLIDSSFVAWGDGTQGGASLAHWDYFRFGVVPEPGGMWSLVLACLVITKPRG